MALTLASALGATDTEVVVTGAVTDDIAVGYGFRLDDEALQIIDFVRQGTRSTGPGKNAGRDRSRWLVARGLGGSVAASHAQGAAVVGATDAWKSGTDVSHGPPWADGGGGGGGGGVPALPWVLDQGWLYSAPTPAVVKSPPDGPTIDQLNAVPLYVPVACHVQRMGATTVQSLAGALGRFGLYADGGGRPGALIYGSDQVDMAATGFMQTPWLSPGPAIGPGWIWVAYVAQGTASPAMHLQGGEISPASEGWISILPTSNTAFDVVSNYFTNLAPNAPLPNPWGAALSPSAMGMPHVLIGFVP